MASAAFDINALAQSGLAALKRGEAGEARSLFERIVPTGRMSPPMWLCLALACRQLGDNPAAAAAADRVLEGEPRNLRALILKGDVLAEAGDRRAASSFYSAALRVAPAAGQLPDDLARELARAEAAVRKTAGDLEALLRGRLAEAGLGDGGRGGRIGETLDILLGRKQIYLQQPKSFYFPGLPQIQFYDRAVFPWLDAIEAETDAMREELRGILARDGAFQPYVEADPNLPRNDFEGMLGNADWSACFLWKNGVRVAEHADRCPQTLAALEVAPLCRMDGRTPSILFSMLRPGAHIPAHTGLTNSRLICHLPLIVPDGCRFRVGNDVRVWEEGKAWVFDDTIEHEAWNDSDRTRVVLIFEIWRPELSEEERLGVATIFAALGAAGAAPDLTI